MKGAHRRGLIDRLAEGLPLIPAREPREHVKWWVDPILWISLIITSTLVLAGFGSIVVFGLGLLPVSLVGWPGLVTGLLLALGGIGLIDTLAEIFRGRTAAYRERTWAEVRRRPEEGFIWTYRRPYGKPEKWERS